MFSSSLSARADSEAERLLRALLKFSRNDGQFDHRIVDDGNTHIKLLEAMKKEFKLVRVMWRKGRKDKRKKSMGALNQRNL